MTEMPVEGTGPAEKTRKQPLGGTAARGSFLAVYKRGQGQYTRWGTFLGAAAMILCGGNFLYDEMSVFRRDDQSWTLGLQVGVPLAVVAACFLLVYWASFVNRRASDFMIATEGEMKKVNWSTRREVFGSTKVVILFTLFLATVLFVVDLVFMSFFGWINVLREAPSVWKFLVGSGA